MVGSFPVCNATSTSLSTSIAVVSVGLDEEAWGGWAGWVLGSSVVVGIGAVCAVVDCWAVWFGCGWEEVFFPLFLRFGLADDVVVVGAPLGVGSLAGAISEAPWCSRTGTGGAAAGVVVVVVRLFAWVAATVPAFWFLSSFLYWGQEMALAGCGPPQFMQVAGSSRGLGQSLAAWSPPHFTHALCRWH